MVLPAVPWLLGSVYVSTVVLPIPFSFGRVYYCQSFFLCKLLDCRTNQETRKEQECTGSREERKGYDCQQQSESLWTVVALHAVWQEQENMALHRFCGIKLFAEVQVAMNRINLTLISKFQKNAAFALQIRHIGIKKQQRPRRSHAPPLNTGYTTMHCSWAAHGHQVVSTVSVALADNECRKSRLMVALLLQSCLYAPLGRTPGKGHCQEKIMPPCGNILCLYRQGEIWESQNVVDK